MTSETPDLDSLEQRLGRLDRENHRLRILGVAALVLGGAALLWSLVQWSSRSLEARSIILRDSTAAKRAELNISPQGMAGLWLYDKSGRSRATLTVLPDGLPSLILYDQSGRNRVELALLADDLPGLALSEQGGIASMGLLVTKDGMPHFRLVDRAGKILVNVP